jgi:hypothetical protein
MVTLDLFCLNLSLIWPIAFLKASALEPEFHEMTLIVTGPAPALAAAAVVGAAALLVVGAGAPPLAGALPLGAAGEEALLHANAGKPTAPRPTTPAALRSDRLVQPLLRW